MQKLTKLFEPGKIGSMTVKNRIILAPLGVPFGSAPSGYTTDKQIAFYEARAAGGVGLIEVTTSIPGPPWGFRTLGLKDDSQIPSARRLASSLQAHGAKVSFSLSHPGYRYSERLEKSSMGCPEADSVISASAVRHPITGWVARPIDRDEISQMIDTFVKAARRGKSAGYDVVRVQASHGYLLHQFLSPRTNKRKDEYGGTLENRCRFACETIRQVRAAVGPEYPIVIRMNPVDFLDDGIQIEEGLEQARMFADAGVDGIDVTTGPRESQHWQFVTMYQPSASLAEYASAIKKAVGRISVSVGGKVGPLLAERILQEGAADFIHMGRALMVDPELPNKAKAGNIEDIRPCIYCNACLERRQVNGETVRLCAVNPDFGSELGSKLVPAEKPKKIVVVGGGLAGMEAARVMAERGHQVSLYEKSDKLGGQWNILSAYRPEQSGLVSYLARGLEKAKARVFLNKEVTSQMVQQMKPDAVVVAAGAKPLLPKIPGINSEKVVMAADVLAGKAETGKEVVIIGGHLVGLDTALFLAAQGKKVSVVEMRKVAWGVTSTLKLALMENLINNSVHMYPDSTLERITRNGVYVVWDSGEGKNETLFLKADTVVLAVGSQSESQLGEELASLMPEVYSIGDCVQPRDVLAAIHEASAIARKI
jgi:2,4-dienoyl-CoA reductase (NADPH2)